MNECGMPKVSIVTPAYNAEQLIERTVQSVIDQDFTDWEMIVVDDCSTDGTRVVVEELARKDKRIRLVPLTRNFGGPAGPRNVGVRSSSGKLIAFLDSDDIWHPQKLSMQVELMEREDANFVCSSMRVFSHADSIKFPRYGDTKYSQVTFLQQCLRARIPTSSVIAAKELLLEHPFEEHIRYKAVEDYHCWLRLLEHFGSFLKIDCPLLYYRKVEGQISGSKVYMMKKVFMVHKEYPGRSVLVAALLTLCHIFGGLYFRYFKRGM